MATSISWMSTSQPQWNPAVKTGSTEEAPAAKMQRYKEPQWNPAVKTGSTAQAAINANSVLAQPQWNPAVKTGSTQRKRLGSSLRSSLNGTRP